MSDPTQINPLTTADLKKLGQSLYRLNEAKQEIDRAEAAGLDLSEETMRCGHLQEKIQALIREYGPKK